jgi:hypothetical protein
LKTQGLRRAGTIKHGDHEFIVYVDDHIPKELIEGAKLDIGLPWVIVNSDNPILSIVNKQEG